MIMRLSNKQIKNAKFNLPASNAITGVADSGKDSIGLHRASYLVKEKCPEADNLGLSPTYNRSLLKYLDFQHQKLRESDMKKGVLIFEIEVPKNKQPTFGILLYEYMKNKKWFKIIDPMDQTKLSNNELSFLHRILLEKGTLR
jgi:hypothetical protein